MPENKDTELRDAFEAWMRSEHGGLDEAGALVKDADGRYLNYTTRAMLRAWAGAQLQRTPDRDAFEKWVAEQYPSHFDDELFGREESGAYLSPLIEAHWQATVHGVG